MVKIRPPRMTEDSKILLRKNGESHVASMLNYAIANQTRREEEKYKWKGKIKPSSLSLDMCFLAYQKTCDKYKKWTLAQKLSFLYGNAIHEFIGKFLVTEYPASYFKPQVPLRSLGWYDRCYPEIPIDAPGFHAKAVMDYVARIASAPVIIDWKTCHMDDETWNKFISNPWVSPMYIMQGASYCFLANALKYFPEPVRRFGFVYINLMLEPSNEYMWKEVYFDYAPYQEIIEMLWSLAIECVEAKLAGVQVPCKNKYCKTHGAGKPSRLHGEADPWNPETPLIVRSENYVLERSNTVLDHVRDFIQNLENPEGFDCLEREEMFREEHCW